MRLPAAQAAHHRTDRQRNRRNIDRRCGHQTGGRGLVTASGQNDAVDRVAVQDLDQTEIGEIAVETGRRTLSGLLDRMDGKFDRHTSRIANTVAHALRKHEMVTIAGRKVGTGLGYADNGSARLQLFERQSEIHVTLEIQRGHIRVVAVVKPRPRTQTTRCWTHVRYPFTRRLRFDLCRSSRAMKRCRRTKSREMSSSSCAHSQRRLHDRPDCRPATFARHNQLPLFTQTNWHNRPHLGKACERRRSVAAQPFTTGSETESSNAGTAFNCLI